jgi:hypothetical protein
MPIVGQSQISLPGILGRTVPVAPATGMAVGGVAGAATFLSNAIAEANRIKTALAAGEAITEFEALAAGLKVGEAGLMGAALGAAVVTGPAIFVRLAVGVAVYGYASYFH